MWHVLIIRRRGVACTNYPGGRGVACTNYPEEGVWHVLIIWRRGVACTNYPEEGCGMYM